MVQRGEEKEVSFDVINTGLTDIKYRITGIPTFCKLKFNKEQGEVPAQETDDDGNPIGPQNRDKITVSVRAQYFGQFQENLYIKIDGTLNWQRLKLFGWIKKTEVDQYIYKD